MLGNLPLQEGDFIIWYLGQVFQDVDRSICKSLQTEDYIFFNFNFIYFYFNLSNTL